MNENGQHVTWVQRGYCPNLLRYSLLNYESIAKKTKAKQNKTKTIMKIKQNKNNNDNKKNKKMSLMLQRINPGYLSNWWIKYTAFTF